MKKVEILSNALVPAEGEGNMRTAYTGSVLELDDEVANQLIASQRAKLADKGAKLVDTTKAHEAAAAERVAAQQSPETMFASAVAAAVSAALQAQQKPAA